MIGEGDSKNDARGAGEVDGSVPIHLHALRNNDFIY